MYNEQPYNFSDIAMIKIILSMTLLVLCQPALSFAEQLSDLTIEEQRIEKARQMMPSVVNRFQSLTDDFKSVLVEAKSVQELTKIATEHGQTIWKEAVSFYQSIEDFDDRPLYWVRLQSTKAMRTSAIFSSLNALTQQQLLWQFELISRGQQDIIYDQVSDKKILLTGFDPFFLDRNIDQSNPSGVIALALDGSIVEIEGYSVEIESLIVPVRFADFDQGMIEQLLTPYMRDKNIDMVITVSMGRDDFDIERFPGLRRSAKAPDNLNVFTGADKSNPLIPLLHNKPLNGPEFVEFSLPASTIVKSAGDFKINDNHNVTTKEKSFSPMSIKELDGHISVSGSGGGYLSNEVSYRSLLLRNAYNPTLAVGHIHTPRFKGFKPEKTERIIQQFKTMLINAIPEL